MKSAFVMLSLVAVSSFGTAKADCPTAPLSGLDGKFQGVLLAVNFQGESQPPQNLTETQTVTSCTSFAFDIRYANPETGEETRRVAFSAEWDEASKTFVLAGPVIHGVLRVIRQGQFVASFDTVFAGNPAHCEEMITLTSDDQQLMRSVQCAAGGLGGPSLGVRTALASRVP